MALFKCTDRGSLHKTQQSGTKSHVCHFKRLPLKTTRHELIGQSMCQMAKHLNGYLFPLKSGSKPKDGSQHCDVVFNDHEGLNVCPDSVHDPAVSVRTTHRQELLHPGSYRWSHSPGDEQGIILTWCLWKFFTDAALKTGVSHKYWSN